MQKDQKRVRSKKNSNCGIAHGALFGSLHYLIDISDMPEVSKYFQAFVFAVDTTSLLIREKNSG